MAKFQRAFFITSALEEKSFSKTLNSHGIPLPEVAIVGRSNVGKSSLINHLVKNASLAKTSARPGKTQTINFFNIDDELCLVDLPGYGFAKVPKPLKEKWAQSIDTYLRTRPALKLLILLLDCRRIPSEEDIELILWARAYDKPVTIVLTKTDKLSAKERKTQKNLIATKLQEYAGYDLPLLTYSIKNFQMRQVLINAINQSLTSLHSDSYDVTS